MCHLLSVPHMLSMCIEQDNSFTASGPNAQHTTCFGCISTVSFHVQWSAARPGDLGMVVMQSPGVGLLQATRDSSNLPYLPDHAVALFVSPHHIPRQQGFLFPPLVVQRSHFTVHSNDVKNLFPNLINKASPFLIKRFTGSSIACIAQ